MTCVRRGRPPLRQVLGGVCVADEGRVVPLHDGAVQRRADARVGLCADDDESPDSEIRQHRLEVGVFERVAVVLLDKRLGVVRGQLGDDLPVVAAALETLIGVLHPDNGNVLPSRLLDEAADVGDDRVALVIPSTTPFCTSTTRRAVLGLFSRVVMVSPLLSVEPLVRPTLDRAITAVDVTSDSFRKGELSGCP